MAIKFYFINFFVSGTLKNTFGHFFIFVFFLQGNRCWWGLVTSLVKYFLEVADKKVKKIKFYRHAKSSSDFKFHAIRRSGC